MAEGRISERNVTEADADSEWALRLVRLPPLMDLTPGASDVSVALIDGPAALDHPELAEDNIRIRALTGRTGVACSKSESVACTHGTHVAGILHAARTSFVRGICPGCTLIVRPIFTEMAAISRNDGVPDATVEELTAAVYEVMEAGASVINMSIGLAEDSSRAEPAIDRALGQAARNGVIVVVAAGNQGVLGSSAITRHPWVIPVVACDRYGRAIARSNLGASIGRNGVMAPGHDISALAPPRGYAKFSGSSAAVPFVSGTVALLWSVFPRASATLLRLAITGGATGRRSVTPPLLDAWAVYRKLELNNGGVRAR